MDMTSWTYSTSCPEQDLYLMHFLVCNFYQYEKWTHFQLSNSVKFCGRNLQLYITKRCA